MTNKPEEPSGHDGDNLAWFLWGIAAITFVLAVFMLAAVPIPTGERGSAWIQAGAQLVGAIATIAAGAGAWLSVERQIKRRDADQVARDRDALLLIGHEAKVTARWLDEQIEALIHKHFDMRPAAIIRDLNLRRPIFKQVAAYGHFGREDVDAPWEKTDKADTLRREAGL